MAPVEKILLTIAIPTYNRGVYLDLCLSQICKQIIPYKDFVELIVSDNCSSDNTPEIVRKHLAYFSFRYVRNNLNLGADRNMEQCFTLSRGKYLWIVGDDDIILDEKLNVVVKVLQGSNYGNIHLNKYSFKNDYVKEANIINVVENEYTVYYNKIDYMQKVNYSITFITGNIFNKSLLPTCFDSKKFIGSNVVQVNWFMTALMAAEKNVVINDVILACKAENTGGYRLFEIFAINFNSILKSFKGHESVKIKNLINKKLLIRFFPSFIYFIRLKNDEVFTEEDYRNILFKTYKKNVYFWIFVAPMIYSSDVVLKWFYHLAKKVETILLKIRFVSRGL